MLFRSHRKANAMKQEPCSLLGYIQSAVQFPGRNAVAITGNEPHGREPLVQANRRVFHHRSSLQSELPPGVSVRALPAVVFWLESDFLGATSGASDAVRPPTRHKVLSAVVGALKVGNRFDQEGRLFAHVSTLAFEVGIVKYIFTNVLAVC